MTNLVQEFGEKMRARYAAQQADANEPRRRRDLTPAELRGLEAQALAAHAQAQEQALKAMVPREHHMSGSEGPSYDRHFVRGLGDVLAEQKRQCGNPLQALAMTAAYCERQGWITSEQRATLDLRAPVVAEVEQARDAERQARDDWEAEYNRIMDKVKAAAIKAGKQPGGAVADALGIWNSNRFHKHADDDLGRWRNALSGAGLL
jgi:hypothetical protein